MPAVDVPHRYPVLCRWMDGANPEHPFMGALSRPDAEDLGQWDTLDEVEKVLETLQKAAPQRLEGKRRECRALGTGDDGLRGKAELVFAAYVAQHRIALNFGAPGTPQPDLVLRTLTSASKSPRQSGCRVGPPEAPGPCREGRETTQAAVLGVQRPAVRHQIQVSRVRPDRVNLPEWEVLRLQVALPIGVLARRLRRGRRVV